MPSKQLFAAFAAVLALTAAVPAGAALAQQPRSTPSTAAPQAVAQTLGMAIMSANVHWNGTLEGGAGAVGASRMAKGEYFVAFNRSVEGCTYVGASSGPASFSFPGFVSTTGASSTHDGATYYGVRVHTADKNVLLADTPFHLIVFCSK